MSWQKSLVNALQGVPATNLERSWYMNRTTHDQTYLKNLTVLYVEDEELTREMTSRFLARITGVLISAKDGVEGLEAYRQHKPGIVVTDIQMPLMDGLSMASEIRAIDTSVPIIVLTAFCDAEYLDKSAKIGIDRYVTKPVDGIQLQEALLACAHRLLVEEKLKQAQALLMSNRG